MLNVYFGDMPEAVYDTSAYFDNAYLDTWFDDEFVRRMVKSIDKSAVLDGGVIESRVLGKVPPTGLSGGVKTLILIYFDSERVFNASTCCDRCAWWILRMASKRDVTVNLRHLMDFGNGKFSIRVLNSGYVVHDMLGLIEEYDVAMPGPSGRGRPRRAGSPGVEHLLELLLVDDDAAADLRRPELSLLAQAPHAGCREAGDLGDLPGA